MKRYVITPPGTVASMYTALGLLNSTMLFKSEEDAREALKFLGVENPEQHTIGTIQLIIPEFSYEQA